MALEMICLLLLVRGWQAITLSDFRVTNVE